MNDPRSSILVPGGVRAGGARGAADPPSYRSFSNFSGKTLMIRAKVLGRKHSKRLLKPDLKATFSDVCPCQDGVKVK